MTTQPVQPVNNEWAQLKDIIYLFLRLTGGPSPQLCSILLKLIDFMDDSMQAKLDSSEVATISAKLLLAIGESICEHKPGGMQTGLQEVAKLNDSIHWAKPRKPDLITNHVLYCDIQRCVDSLQLNSGVTLSIKSDDVAN